VVAEVEVKEVEVKSEVRADVMSAGKTEVKSVVRGGIKMALLVPRLAPSNTSTESLKPTLPT